MGTSIHFIRAVKRRGAVRKVRNEHLTCYTPARRTRSQEELICVEFTNRQREPAATMRSIRCVLLLSDIVFIRAAFSSAFKPQFTSYHAEELETTIIFGCGRRG
jgi:hypothetical protein